MDKTKGLEIKFLRSNYLKKDSKLVALKTPQEKKVGFKRKKHRQVSNKCYKIGTLLKWKQYYEEGYKIPIEGINAVVHTLTIESELGGEIKRLQFYGWVEKCRTLKCIC